MYRLSLSENDVLAMQSLLKEISGCYTSAEDQGLLQNATLYAQELPRSVRTCLNRFRLTEPASACVISGFPIDDARIGKTPGYWKECPEALILNEEILLVLYASLLGDVFGWSTQQGGHVVHDIVPIKGHENEQMGSGSEQTLWWHTEEAFHSYRCDYLGLFCMRNLYNIPTTIATAESIDFCDPRFDILFHPLFSIRPDESHFKKHKSALQAAPNTVDQGLDSAYLRIEQMNCDPPRVPVLFGDRHRPYLRIDPFFMDPVDDPCAQQALDLLCQTINEHIAELVLQAGECCFIDNYRTVHGRKAFKPRYDGFDRWIKRVNITRDLRKSRDSRPALESRIIF